MKPTVEWQAARVAAEEAAAREKHERLMAKDVQAAPSARMSARARKKAYKKAWEDNRKAAGICVNCPSPSLGFSKCAECRARGIIFSRLAYARKRGE